MLTWWLQADIHFTDEDYFQQNLHFTLQAISMEADKIVTLNMHEEIAADLSVIISGQIGTWIACSMVKAAVFTTGKGDIFFRILFATSAKTFLLAQEATRILKSRLEYGIYTQFGLCLSANLVKTFMVTETDSNTTPAIKPVENKQMVLMMATEEARFTPDELLSVIEKEYMEFETYSTPEVDQMVTDSSNSDGLVSSPLTPDTSATPDTSLSDPDIFFN